MKKYIKLGKSYIEDGGIKVVIEEQSHIREEFGKDDQDFKSSNGIKLRSENLPEVCVYTIFVRGRYAACDAEPLTFDSLEKYNKFVEAVKEYNEYFSKPQIKEMTMEELCKELGYEVKIKKEA